MSEAPERIWVYPSYVTGWDSANAHNRKITNAVEYVRADRIEELEAKLAKAVDGLNFYGNWNSWEVDERNVSAVENDEGKIARTTIAELIGESQ